MLSIKSLGGMGFVLALLLLAGKAAGETEFRSHPPARPLPVASDRPLGGGPGYYVNPAAGDDANEGTRERPWKSVAQGVARLKPGDTLYLRGGTYYEHVSVGCSDEAGQPITIRSCPGELAILDGGLREFLDDPATAWEPCPDGVEGEYWSTKTYPGLGTSEGGVNVRGHFADSMVPLLGYRLLIDLRDSSMAWDVEDKVGSEEGVYCGPGVWFDIATGRIHCRLAHTTMRALGDDNYRGETDPRKLPLLIAGAASGPVLTASGAHDLVFQDLVVRGSATATVEVRGCARMVFDGLTVYGGHTAFQVTDTAGLRLLNTACRGAAAPWTFRGHLKYRSTEARIFSASGWSPTGNDNRHFELAWSEFTDCVDGVFIGNVQGVHFHHNLVDNVSDDGIFLTATTAYDGTTPGGDVRISQNLLSRCLTTFAFGVGHGRQKAIEGGVQTGAGVTIARNVLDFRRPVMYHFPEDLETSVEIPFHGRFASDHGSPAWEPMTIYHNTILADDPDVYYGTAGLGDHLGGGAARRVFNNIVCQMRGMPGQALPEIVLPASSASTEAVVEEDPLAAVLDLPDPAETDTPEEFSAEVDPEKERKLAQAAAAPPPAPPPTDFQADGNLFWSLGQGPTFAGEFLDVFRHSQAFETSKQLYPPGWTANDRFADPQFVRLSADWREACDLSLQPGSPAIDGGQKLISWWPDPIREADERRPDIGALPAGVKPWRVGVRGRLDMFGAAVSATEAPAIQPTHTGFKSDLPLAVSPELIEWLAGGIRTDVKPAALVEGYPEFDAPLLTFALATQRIGVERFGPGTWLPPSEYKEYSLVVIAGDLQRAGTQPDRYTAEELTAVEDFLEQGGVLILLRRGKRVFDLTPQGQAFLKGLIGEGQPERTLAVAIQDPKHPWVRHLDPDLPRPWLDWQPDGDTALWLASEGERIIASPGGNSMLYRLRVGKGQLIYLGWQVAESMPDGRSASTPEKERLFEEQMQVLMSMAADFYPTEGRAP